MYIDIISCLTFPFWCSTRFSIPQKVCVDTNFGKAEVTILCTPTDFVPSMCYINLLMANNGLVLKGLVSSTMAFTY